MFSVCSFALGHREDEAGQGSAARIGRGRAMPRAFGALVGRAALESGPMRTNAYFCIPFFADARALAGKDRRGNHLSRF
jgi:hypothetical protein